MAITPVGTPTTSNNGDVDVTTASGITVSWDKTGLQADDVLEARVVYGYFNAETGPTPSGWTKQVFTNVGATVTISYGVFTRKITQADLDNGSLTSFTFFPSTNAIAMAVSLRALRGVDPATMLSGTPQIAGVATFQTAVQAPSVTTLDDGAFVSSSIALRTNGTANKPTMTGGFAAAGLTDDVAGTYIGVKTTSSSSGRAIDNAYTTKTTAGATGTFAGTASEACAYIGATLAYKAAAGSGAGVANVRSGGVTDAAAKISVKLTGVTTSSAVRTVFATDSGLSTGVVNGTVGNPDSAGRILLPVSGLAADTAYYYGIEVDGALIAAPAGRGNLVTNPTPGTPTSYKVACGSCKGLETTFAVGPAIQTYAPRFMVVLGDGNYADRNTAVVTDYDADYDAELSIANFQALCKAMPLVEIWSDHNYAGGDNAGGATTGATSVSQSWRKCRPLWEYAEPVDTAGIEQQPQRIGRVWHYPLDTRRNRSLYTATDNSSKTMLGTAQKDRLKIFLSAYPNAVKILYMDGPWVSAFESTEDHWGRYITERTELVNYCSANSIRNVMVVAGDMHSVASTNGISGSPPGGFPVLQAAPLDREGTVKSGTYQYGPEPGDTSGVFVQRFGYLDIQDTGGADITINFGGKNSSGTNTITDNSVTFTSVADTQPAPDAAQRIFIVDYTG